ncbi:MAG: retroviral-like aspartic protease family protein [Acidobacteriaceae bacterium]|nr:retroviral-like aspartic protease family protein [Acidobacteriaceae bacterium]
MFSVALWAQASPDLKQLYDRHEWFLLRDALTRDPSAPALYRGAVAAAFNNVAEAQQLLKAVMDKGSDSEADDANKWLMYLYVRTGQYQKAAALTDDDTGMVRMLRQLPDQSINDFAPITVPAKISNRQLFFPASISGKPIEFFLDSDANFSFMSEAQARNLGLAVHDSAASVHGVTGKDTAFRVAVADQLAIGAAQLTHVAFLVLPDSSEVFRSAPLSRQGALGIPVLTALRSIRFVKQGTLEIGATRAQNDTPNLCFDGFDPVARVDFEQRPLPVVLDTGAQVTEIWPSFANQFPECLKSGKNSSKLENGFGGRAHIPERLVPDLTLCIGGFDTHVHPAHVLLAQTVPASDWYYGRLGLDVLSQADDITIDFASLHVTLR